MLANWTLKVGTNSRNLGLKLIQPHAQVTRFFSKEEGKKDNLPAAGRNQENGNLGGGLGYSNIKEPKKVGMSYEEYASKK